MPWQGMPSTSDVDGGICAEGEPAGISGVTLAAARASEIGCAQPGAHDDITSGTTTSPRHVICRIRWNFIRVDLPQRQHGDLNSRSQATAGPNANGVEEYLHERRLAVHAREASVVCETRR
jgi:hypothetical protein